MAKVGAWTHHGVLYCDVLYKHFHREYIMGSVTQHTSKSSASTYHYGRSVVAFGGNPSDDNRSAVNYDNMAIDAEGGGPTSGVNDFDEKIIQGYKYIDGGEL